MSGYFPSDTSMIRITLKDIDCIFDVNKIGTLKYGKGMSLHRSDSNSTSNNFTNNYVMGIDFATDSSNYENINI